MSRYHIVIEECIEETLISKNSLLSNNQPFFSLHALTKQNNLNKGRAYYFKSTYYFYVLLNIHSLHKYFTDKVTGMFHYLLYHCNLYFEIV